MTNKELYKCRPITIKSLTPKTWKSHKTLLRRPLDLNSDKLCSEFKTKRLKNFGNQVRHIFVRFKTRKCLVVSNKFKTFCL